MEEFDLMLADETQQPAQSREIEGVEAEPFNFKPCGLVHRERFWARRGLEKR
jgi:hypothetical protein